MAICVGAFDPVRPRPIVRPTLLDCVMSLPTRCCVARYTQSLVSFWFARSVIGTESPTAVNLTRTTTTSASTSLAPTSLIVWPSQGMRCRGDAFLRHFSVIQSARLHCRFNITTNRSERLHRLLPLSLHLARTRSVQPIMHRLPSSHDVHRRVLRASSPSNRASLLLCRLVRLYRRPCVRFAMASTSPSHVHQRVLRNLCCAIRQHHVFVLLIWSSSSRVFVIELPLLMPSLSPAHRSPPCLVTKPYSPMRPLPHYFVQHNHVASISVSSLLLRLLRQPRVASTPSTPPFCAPQPVVETFSNDDAWLGPSTLYARYWQHQHVLSSPNALLGLANPARASTLRHLDCINFGIDPPTPTPSSSPFFDVHDGPDCVNFSIASSHDNCFNVSLSSSWHPLCTLQPHQHSNQPQLHRPWPSSARLLRLRLLRPHARLP